MTGKRLGIYFLGDDAVYDWALGLLHSLRLVAPDVSVYCIPFSDRLERLGRLQRRYGFDIIDDPSLVELDEIARQLFGKMTRPPTLRLAGMFRKFYAFWGPLDRFFYTDADVVLLDGFPRLFEAVTASESALTYAHADVEQVYRPSQLRETMIHEYATHAINAGLWASRSGVFTLAQVRALAERAEPLADDFCATLDQPFLNYCLDMSRISMRAFDVEGMSCAWAGDPRPLTITFGAAGRLEVRWPDGSLVPAIHWAGYRIGLRSPHYDIYRHFGASAMSYRERAGLLRRELSETRAGAFARRVRRRLARTFRGR